MYKLFFLLVVFLSTEAQGQARTDKFLLDLLRQDTGKQLHQVLNEPDKYRCQVVYTQINRDRNNQPTFTNYYFNENPTLYFNPASTVKLPLAFLSLEKLAKMNVKGVNKYTPIQFDSSFAGQTTAFTDSTAENNLPSIAQYIRKAFLISDNDAYNRMYEFVGQQAINKNLHDKGYPDVRITRQFMGFNAEQNRHTNPVRFLGPGQQVIYTQPAAYNSDSIYFPQEIKVGIGYLDAKDSLVNEPIDFTGANNYPLKDYQQLLQSVLFPQSVPVKQRFTLTSDDRQFLVRYLSQFPSETSYPKYDTAEYYDSYVKFFFKQGAKKLPEVVRVFNKVGWAYGFLTDISYVVDFKNKVEFMLAATVYVNSDGILNDNKYDYDSIGYPFMYQLGQSIYRYERHRKRAFLPDLSAFKIKYDKRSPSDLRPAIKDAEN